MIKIIKYFLQAIIIYFFFIIGKLIGLNNSQKIFSLIFVNIGPFFKSKRIIDKNLDIFSRDITFDQKEKIKKNMWSNFGMTFIEYIFLNKFRSSDKYVEIEGEEILNEILIKNEQVIFVSGHFANFELMSMEITKKKINLAAIYRPLNNFFLNPFMEYLREKYVCKNQIKKGIKGVKKVLNYINSNHSIALMIDQRVSEGEKINFFNQKAFTTTLPAQLAFKYNLKIIPIFIERNKQSSFKMKIFDPVNYSNYANKIELSKKLNFILEKMIVKNPYQWIWTHDRWK